MLDGSNTSSGQSNSHPYPGNPVLTLDQTPAARGRVQSSPYFDPTHTRTGWIGQPPILDRLEVVTDNGDVDTLGQATP